MSESLAIKTGSTLLPVKIAVSAANVFGALSKNERTMKLFHVARDILALIAFARYGGDLYHALEELGLLGVVKAIFLYPVLRSWVFAKRNIPFLKNMIDDQIGEALGQVEAGLLKEQKEAHLRSYLVLPEGTMSSEDVLRELREAAKIGAYKYKDGKISGCVYNGTDEVSILANESQAIFQWTNPLHADLFPGLRKLESEIVAMVVNMFHGSHIGACGAVTSGGTESILMAVRAHKEWAKSEKGITSPHMAIPVTAHPAFDKAADYFGIRVTHVPVDPVTFQVDVHQMKRSITSNTIMIVGSCPSFPWGIMDDIEELGKLASAYNVGLHVDCCLGSFLVAFMEEAGYPLAPFDFRVNGVTSISCDTHKYGFSPKGTSVVMYRTPDLRRFQYFCQPNWPGGIYASPSVAGSRPGQVIAGTWAIMMAHGKEGYIAATKKIVNTCRTIIDCVKHMDDLQVMGDPKVSVVAFSSTTIDVYRVSEGLKAKGWNLNLLQYPKSFHLCCVYLTDAETFCRELKEVMHVIRENPMEECSGSAAFYGQSATIPDRSLVGRIAYGYIDTLYVPFDGNKEFDAKEEENKNKK